MKHLLITAALLLALPATAAPILTPTTITYGGVVNGGNFVTGVSTTVFSPPSNGWPSVQGPNKAEDGVIGPGSKYLNLNVTDTALIFSGTTARVANRLELWVAEDAVERDPASYILYGTNIAIPVLNGGSTIALGSLAFTEISSGSLTLPATRDTTADATGFSQSIRIPNTTAYASYLLVFPTVKNAPTAANAMQISEVQLYDSGIIGTDSFDYADGPITERTGGQFWNWRNRTPATRTAGISDWDETLAAPVVTGGRLITDNSSAQREYNGPQEGLPIDRDEGFGAISAFNNGVVSFLHKTVYYRATFTTGSTLPASITLLSSDFGTDSVAFGLLSGSPNFAIRDIRNADAQTNSTTPVAANTTYTVVAKLDFGNGSTGTASLFVNPDLNAAEPSPTVTRSFNATFWSSRLKLASGSGGSVAWDDLVVATAWDDLGTVVTTPNDEDNGSLLATAGGGEGVSLREAVKYSPTGRITFAQHLAGELIRLKLGEIPITGEITIDASGLSSGLIIDANEKSRHFQIDPGQSLTATGLTLGWGRGGSIENRGTLRLTRCTLMENRGGALLLSDAQTHLDHCTLTGNVGDNSGSLTGGVDVLFGTCTLTHCTISGNQGSGGGGGLSINGNSASVTITRCILAGNSDTVAADIRKIAGNLNITGPNLIGNNQTVESDFSPSALVGTPAAPISPRLSPAGRFGGLPFTMHPLIGSPAIDAAGSTHPGGTDARGYSRLVDGDAASSGAQLDIGAVEAGPLTTVTVAADPGLPGSLRTVINNAVTPGARIGFSGSVFPSVISLAQGELSIAANQSVFIDASNLTAPVTISGENATRIFRVNPRGTLAMQNLHLINGKPTQLPLAQGNINAGGAIFNDGTLTMLQAEIRNCTTIVSDGAVGDSDGGGAINNRGSTHLSRCRLEQNVADASPTQIGNEFTAYRGGSGGAIRNNLGTLTILDSIFRENRTDDSPVPGHGGAIFNRDKLKIVRSTLELNTGGSTTVGFEYQSVGGSGGAIFNDSAGDASISACLLSQNIAGNHFGAGGVGGGIANGGHLTVHRSTITGNRSGSGIAKSGTGGGIGHYMNPEGYSGNLEVTHCTITGNRSNFALTPTPTGSGIHNDTTTPYVLRHSIVSDNLTQNIVEGTSVTTDLVGPVTQTENLIGGNPLLLPLADNGGPTQTIALMPGSPAINAAFTSNSRTDQRDYPIVGAPDIGAYENERPVFSPPPVAVIVAPGVPSVIVPFFVADRESGAAALTIVSLSKDGVIVPNPLFISSGANRTVTLAGPFSLSDPPAVYTIVISDGSATASASFTLTVGIAPASLIVSNVNDAGEGSLRQALANAATKPGPDTVTFAPGFTGPVTLSSEIVINDPAGVTLDASDRPNGLVIDGGTGTNRHFRIMAGTTATFLRLRLYGGNGTGGGGTTDGGSIHTSGTLTLRECTITDCASPSAAGAILSDHPGVLTLEHCTLHGNSSVAGGGAITQLSENILTLTSCTIANNTAGSEAGGINAPFGRPVQLDHCTVSGNAVIQTGGNGVGGVRGDGGGVPGVTLRNSIISGNTDANLPGTPNIGAFRRNQGNNVIDANANLAALGDYGGPTWTMPPRAGSPAIDAATSSTADSDQRGVARPLNGDNSGLAHIDIGAVEAPGFLTVTTRFDENETPAGPTVSLREAIRDAEPGATILFAPSFNGESLDTITLNQSLGEIAFTKGLIIDASGNTGGVTIDGGLGDNRIFYLPAGTGASLHRLTLTGGNGNFGGAIFCDGGRLALKDCTLTGNISINGGAINNNLGTLTLDSCQLSGNNATGVGGAIRSLTAPLTGPATSSTSLTNCTLTGNVSSSYGGAIRNSNGRTTLLHCTIFDNTAIAPSGSGVDSYGDDFTRTTVQNCLIVGNDNLSDTSFFLDTNTFLSLGGNVIGSGNAIGAFNQTRDSTNVAEAAARLAPLADYGGLTRTIALRPGSPARDIATPSRVSTDQRGFSTVLGTKDSGAYEAGNALLTDYNAFIWETLPNTATLAQTAATFDFDGDGASNEFEWLSGTLLTNNNSYFRVTQSAISGNTFNVTFPTVSGRTYQLQSSPNLANPWINIGTATPGTGGNVTLPVSLGTETRYFFRVSVQ